MIRINNLSKKYGNHEVLKNINMTLPDHGLVLIYGDSGCGKTTLFNCLSSLLTYKGNIVIDGLSLESLSESSKNSFRNQNIGFIFQDFKLFSNDSVINNVMLALDLNQSLSKTIKEHKCIDLLTLVKMENKRKRIVNTLSGGEKQRVAIARALASDPKIILADEPTGALDNKNAVMVMELLKQVSNDSLVIVVSHDYELAKNYADILIHMKDGEILSSSAQQISNKDKENKIISNGYRKSRARIPLSFLFRHSFTALRSKKWRMILCSSLISLGLIGTGLSLTLSSSISSNIKEAYSQIVDETKIMLSQKNDGNIIPVMEGGEYLDAMDIASTYKDYIFDVGTIYLTNLEKHFYDDNSFVVDYDGRRFTLPGLRGKHINEFRWLDNYNETVYPRRPYSLKNNEIVLGLNLNLIQMICDEFKIPRNVDHLSSYISTHELQIVFTGRNDAWEYDDQQSFIVKGFTLSIEPAIYHFNHQWNQYVLEECMRFPSTTSVASNPKKPWTLKKLYYFECKGDTDLLFDELRKSPLSDDYVFELGSPSYFPLTIEEDAEISSINKILFLINNGVSISYRKILSILENHPYLSSPLIGTSGGYGIYPSSLMMGFSSYAYCSLDYDLLEENLNIYSTLSIEENEMVQNSKGINIGHYSRSMQKGVNFVNIGSKKPGFSFSSIDEVMVSSALYNSLNYDNQNHNILYFSYLVNEQYYSEDFIIRDYRTVPLKIIGIIDSEDNAIYQNTSWLISFFKQRIGLSSYSLFINTLSFDVKDKRSMNEIKEELEKDYPQFEVVNPLGDIDKNVKEVCGYIELAMNIFSIVAILISIILMSVSNLLHFLENKKDIGLSRCLGVSKIESCKFLLFYSSLISLSAFILSSIELVFVSYFISRTISDSLSSSTSFSLNPFAFLMMFVLAISISLLSSILICLKYANMSPLEEIK